MFLYTVLFAVASFSIVSAQSESFVDSLTGITFQRVQTDSDGSSVAIALPPQGATASDAIIQITGPVSRGLAGVSPAPDLGDSVAVACCWCCDNRRGLGTSAPRPKFDSRHLNDGSLIKSSNAIQPVFTQVADPELTEDTFKITFRCQNITFSQSNDLKFATLSTIFSTNNPSSISDHALKLDPATDIVRNVQFDLAAAKFDAYWDIVDRLAN